MSVMHRTSVTILFAAVFALPIAASALTMQERTTLILQLVQKVLELQEKIVALGGTPIAIPPNLAVLAQGSVGGVSSGTLPSCILSRTLALGARGEDVSCLQRFLISQNLLASDSATGYFGKLTRAAVIMLQRRNNLELVGHVGRLTRGIVNTSAQSGVAAPPPPGPSTGVGSSGATGGGGAASGGGESSGGGGGGSSGGGGGGGSQTSSTALACTLSISPASIKAGNIFTLSWTSTGTPATVSGYLEQTAPDNSKATFFRPIPYSSYLLPNGGRSGKAGMAGAYTYTFVVSNATATTSCSTGLSVTGTAPLPMIHTILDRVGKGLFSTAGQNDTQHDVAFGGPVNINLNASTTIFYGYYIPYSR